jgi:hypothetical protein
MFPFARCSFQVTWQSSRAKSRKPRAHDPIGIDISRVGLLESDPPKGFSTEENSPGHLLSSLGERWTEKFLAHVRVSVAYTKVGKEVASQWRRIRVRDQFPVQHQGLEAVLLMHQAPVKLCSWGMLNFDAVRGANSTTSSQRQRKPRKTIPIIFSAETGRKASRFEEP